LTFDKHFFKAHVHVFQKIKTIFSIDPLQFISSLYEQIYNRMRFRSMVSNNVGGYSIHTIDQVNGDEMSVTHKNASLKIDPVISIDKSLITKDCLKSLNELRKWCKHNNIRLILTFPNTAYLKDYERNDYKVAINNLTNKLQEYNFEVLGEPQDAMVDPKYLYDTPYHLNTEGTTIRTKKLISLLEQKLIS